MSKPKYLVGLNCILLGNQLKAKGISNANIVSAHSLGNQSLEFIVDKNNGGSSPKPMLIINGCMFLRNQELTKEKKDTAITKEITFFNVQLNVEAATEYG